MIIPLDKLMIYNDNKYVFTRAAMRAVDKVANIRDYPEHDHNWKIVPNILKMTLEGELKLSSGQEEE